MEIRKTHTRTEELWNMFARLKKLSQTSAVAVFVVAVVVFFLFFFAVGGKHGDHFSSFPQDKVIISPILIIKLKEVERGHRSSRL